LRTASLEFDISFLRDFYSWAQKAHAGISIMTCLARARSVFM
jgi:hypothetical protein